MSALLDAVVEFEDRLMLFDVLLEAFDQASGDAPPAWLPVMMSQAKALNQALEPVSTLARGIGGVDPDIAKRDGIKGVEL